MSTVPLSLTPVPPLPRVYSHRNLTISLFVYSTETSSISFKVVYIFSFATSLVLGPGQISSHVLGATVRWKFIH